MTSADALPATLYHAILPRAERPWLIRIARLMGTDYAAVVEGGKLHLLSAERLPGVECARVGRPAAASILAGMAAFPPALRSVSDGWRGLVGGRSDD